jgi:hypothetical protein
MKAYPKVQQIRSHVKYQTNKNLNMFNFGIGKQQSEPTKLNNTKDREPIRVRKFDITKSIYNEEEDNLGVKSIPSPKKSSILNFMERKVSTDDGNIIILNK